MSLPGAHALVTGASGFVAASVKDALSAAGCRISGVTRGSGDLSERHFWKAVLPGVDIIVHLAAQTSVYDADADPVADWRANVLPMLSLLEAARETDQRPLVLFAGSCTQFGQPRTLPVSEDEPDRPVSIYDRHKSLAEAYLQHYASRGWARGATLRLANVYGPGPISSKPDRGILNMMMRRALAGQNLTLYGEGRQVRDYIFVRDVASAFVAAAANPDVVNGGRFVVSSGRGASLAEAFDLVAERAAHITGKRVAVERVAPPEGQSAIDDRSFVGDPSRLRAATGWSPAVSLSAGIDLTLAALAR